MNVDPSMLLFDKFAKTFIEVQVLSKVDTSRTYLDLLESGETLKSCCCHPANPFLEKLQRQDRPQRRWQRILLAVVAEGTTRRRHLA